MVSIVLADDHGVVREGVRMLLELNAGVEVLAEAADVDAARRAVREHRPDVLVLDLNMRGESSLTAISRLRAEFPATAVVILTMQSEPQVAREALREGAAGYVLKDGDHAQLIEAITAAASGGTYLDPLLGEKMVAEPPPGGPPDGLTPRELEVLKLLAAGYTNAEVGRELYMSVRTAESHRAHVLRKTGCTSRADITRYALRRGLIDR